MHVFLSEDHPHSVVMAERAPEPGWQKVKPAAPPESAAPPRPAPVPKLADTPAGRFHQLAELRARIEGCSLTEAYSRQSESTPELWADVRNDQPRY
jgi:hypothetical protein